jgi:hypothetical protein
MTSGRKRDVAVEVGAAPDLSDVVSFTVEHFSVDNVELLMVCVTASPLDTAATAEAERPRAKRR